MNDKTANSQTTSKQQQRKDKLAKNLRQNLIRRKQASTEKPEQK